MILGLDLGKIEDINTDQTTKPHSQNYRMKTNSARQAKRTSIYRQGHSGAPTVSLWSANPCSKIEKI